MDRERYEDILLGIASTLIIGLIGIGIGALVTVIVATIARFLLDRMTAL